MRLIKWLGAKFLITAAAGVAARLNFNIIRLTGRIPPVKAKQYQS